MTAGCNFYPGEAPVNSRILLQGTLTMLGEHPLIDKHLTPSLKVTPKVCWTRKDMLRKIMKTGVSPCRHVSVNVCGGRHVESEGEQQLVNRTSH